MRVLMCLMLALVLIGSVFPTTAQEYPHHVNPAEIEKSSTAGLAPFQYETINGLLLRFGFLLEAVRERNVEGIRDHYIDFTQFYRQNSLVMGTLDPSLRKRLFNLAQFVNISTRETQILIEHYQRAEHYLREGRRDKAVGEIMGAIDMLNKLNESSKMVYAPEFYLYPNIKASVYESNIESLTELTGELANELGVLESQAFYPTKMSLSLVPSQAGFGDSIKVQGRLYYQLNDTGIENKSVNIALQHYSHVFRTKAGGFYEERLTLTQYLERGTTDVYVSYIPTNVPAQPAHARKPLRVLSKPTNLTLDVAPRVLAGSSVNISGKLTSTGIPLHDLSVKIVVDRFVYVVSTDKEGDFTLNVDSSKMERGVHRVRASFEPGPLAFLPSNATAQFELVPKLTTSPTLHPSPPTSSTTPRNPYLSIVGGIVGMLAILTLLWTKKEQVMAWFVSTRRKPKAPEPQITEADVEEPTEVGVEEAKKEDERERIEESIRAIEMKAEQEPRDAVRAAYLLARKLIAQRAGIEDDPTLTHMEFLERLEGAHRDGPFGMLTTLYEFCEFSGNPTTPEEAKRALELVKQIEGNAS